MKTEPPSPLTQEFNDAYKNSLKTLMRQNGWFLKQFPKNPSPRP